MAFKITSLLLLICPFTFAQDKPLLIWVKNNAPPFYELYGSEQNQVIGDTVQAMLQDRLPQYEHQTRIMPLARMNSYWEQGEPLCFATMIYRQPQNDTYLLSAPNIVYFPPGIIFHQDNSKRILAGQSTFDFSSSNRTPPLILGMIPGRAFGNKIDNSLTTNAANFVIMDRHGSDETHGMLRMLVSKRLDLVIDYEMVLKYYRTEHEIQQHLRFAPIAGMENDILRGAVGCTNSEWGKHTIAAINIALADLIQSSEYQQTLSAWFSDLLNTDAYLNVYRQQILGQTQ